MFRSRPFLPPASAFVSGIAAEEAGLLPPELWVLLVVVGLAGGILRGPPAKASLLAAVLGAGALAHSGNRLPWDPSDLRWRIAGQNRLCEVRGTLLESPSVRLVDHDGVQKERTSVRLGLEAWREPGREWEPATGVLMVGADGVLGERFHRGVRAQIEGVVGPPPGPALKGMLDYERFLGLQGVGLLLRCRAPEDWRFAAAEAEDVGAPPWDERFQRWAQGRLSAGLPDDEASRLVRAMLLGWRTGLAGGNDDAFLKSGTLHLFAISGLHVALVAVALVQGLRVLGVSRGACGLFALPLSWFYVAATGWQPSAVRSAVMCSVVAGTWALDRPSDLLNSLALSALLLLAWEPGQLFQAGFLLSFAVVGAIPLLQPTLETGLWRIRPAQPDPLVPERLHGRARRLYEEASRATVPALANGIAAFLASVPFTAHFFHLVSPVAVLVNLAAIPVGTLVLVAGMLSLLLPFGTEVWNASAWAAMHLLVLLARGAAELPGGWFRLESPPPWIWIPYGMGLAILATGNAAAGRILRLRFAVAAATSLLAAAGWFRVATLPRITVFPSGEAILVRGGRDGPRWLLDASDASGARHRVVPALWAQGIGGLDAAGVSRASARQAGGLPVVLEAMSPRIWFHPHVGIRGGDLREAGTAARRVGSAEFPLRIGEAWGGWTVLHPGPDSRHPRMEDRSLVLAGRLGGWRILLAPALGPGGQADLVARMSNRLRADLLITGNPAVGQAAGDAFLEAVRPRIVVLAGSRIPPQRRTPPVVRRRLRGLPAKVLFTEETGGLELRCGDSLEVVDARGETLATIE